jgi:quercetin 2,3-dioxygenase
MTRRQALELLAAAGVVAGTAGVAGCTESAPARRARHDVDPVLGVTRLGFPWQTRDPFLFCVHHDDHYPAGNAVMGPAASLAGRDLGQDFAGKDGWRMYHGDLVPGFPQHPHRGFETVTVVRRGLLDHSDSLGAAARYGEGDVQWLTAGKGILHSEMFPLLDAAAPNPVELFQIWVNLPASDKMVDPHFTMSWDQVIPRHVSRDRRGATTELRVVAGRTAGLVAAPPPPHSWAARTDSDVAIWTIKMSPGARWALPAAARGTDRSLYFFRGEGLRVGRRSVLPAHRVDLRADLEVPLEAGRDVTELLLLQGRPIGEPVVKHGPFVMNTRDEIRQAFADYRATQFGGWPWPSHEPVHGRDPMRFARREDGRVERPT